MNKLFIVVLVILLLSCNNNNNNNDKRRKVENKYLHLEEQKGDSPRIITIKKAQKVSELFTLKQVIPLESNKNSLIGKIESIIYLKTQQKIVILDKSVRKRVFVFNTKGKYLNMIGKKGHGPGEYSEPSGIAFSNGVLAVIDKNSHILFYKLNGNLVNEIYLKQNGWRFSVESMAFLNNNIFLYTNNEYSNFSPNDDERFRVFKVKNNQEFQSAYGKPEECFGFGGGDIAIYNGKVIFTGLFNGELYTINAKNESTILFSSFGYLTDIEKIRKSGNHIKYIVENINDIKAINKLGVIGSLLFVRISKNISIVNDMGEIIKEELKMDIRPPEGFRFPAIRMGYLFYDKGLILASVDEKNIQNDIVPNPSLLLYEFNLNK